MDKRQLLQFMRSHHFGVQSSVTPSGAAQSAVVGFAVADDLRLVFDTIDTSRKVQNLRKNQKIAFVIGGLSRGDARTVQYEGLADEPTGDELESLKEVYFKVFPSGRERQNWPGICYIRVRPTWIRYTDYNKSPPEVVEFSEKELRSRE